MAKLLNKKDYAKSKGISAPRLSKLISDKVIPVESNGKIDPVKADKAMARWADPYQAKTRKFKSKAIDKAEATLSESRILKEGMLAKLKELEFMEKSGAVATTAGIKKKAFDLGRRVRDAMFIIPDRMSSLTFQQKEELRAEIHKALSELTGPA